jgi:hypothetical protein
MKHVEARPYAAAAGRKVAAWRGALSHPLLPGLVNGEHWAYASLQERKRGLNGTTFIQAEPRRRNSPKPSSDQKMRSLEDYLEILDARIAEIEARQVVENYIDEQRALVQKFRRKMN